MKLTDEQTRMLAECERMMDNGEIPYVMWRGNRTPMMLEVMEYFGLKTGQTITYETCLACVELTDEIWRACVKSKTDRPQD